MASNSGLAALADRLRSAAERLPEERRIALEHIGEHAAEKARDMLGTYQPEVGPFEAWAPLAEATQADRVQQGYSPDDPLLRSGALAASIDHRVEGDRAVAIGSPRPEMVWMEHGTVKAPPRASLGPAVLHSEEFIIEQLSAATARAFEKG
jgi:hypothetical protein